ncbi:MAG: RNA-binding protein [Candidatus Omnitrophica bacterium]|nr:RNA-binding protein [Candidatus Omnitrophota bacterium]
MNIFVGNLSFNSTETDVGKLFEGFGSVASVFIVIQKNGKKSRGFGFVQMLDEKEAQAAIAALAGKEFMGRPLNVEAARPKSEAGQESRKRKKIRSEINMDVEQYPRQEKDDKNVRLNTVFQKTEGYKGGRRSRSFMMRSAAAGIEEQDSLKRKNHENPMRWRKKQGQPKPWKKADRESRPWRKTTGESRPWKKTDGESRPWRKTTGESRPWKKAEGESRPWRKSNERPQQSRFNPSGMVRTSTSSARMPSGVERIREKGERSRPKRRGKYN